MRQKVTTVIVVNMLLAQGYAQNVGINPTGASPNNDAALDVDYSNKGLLIPRVNITSLTTFNPPITSGGNTVSLLVYNTNTTTGTGYHYWNGTQWIKLLANTSPADAWLTTGNAGTNSATHFLGTTDAQDLVIKTNNIERMRILQSNGNVGIGTNSPSSLLHVQGGHIVVSNTGGIGSMVRSIAETFGNHDILVYHINNFPAFVGLRGRGTISSPTYPNADDILASFVGRDVIDGYSPTQLYGGCEIQMRTNENWTNSNKGAYMAFITTQAGSNTPTEKMRLSGAGNLLVGFTTPAAPYLKLDVNGWIAARNDYGDIVYIGGDNIGMDGQMGLSSPSRNYLTFYNVNQGLHNDCFAQSFNIISDTTLKQNIQPIPYGLNEVLQLTPIGFEFKKGDNGRKRVGLIAQELHRIMPELIESKEHLFVRYMDYTAVLTKAIQEQQQQIEELKKQNQELKKLTSNIQSQLNLIKTTLQIESSK